MSVEATPLVPLNPPSEGDARAPRSWYVSTTGDDGNDGTRDNPLLNPATAASRAASGDVIYLFAGLSQQPDRFGAPQGVAVISLNPSEQ